jgi:hypothetical protein
MVDGMMPLLNILIQLQNVQIAASHFSIIVKGGTKELKIGNIGFLSSNSGYPA